MEDNLENLKMIDRVEAPPFLFTRILGRIESLQYPSKRWKLAFLTAAIVVFVLNATILFKPVNDGGHFGDVVSVMHLSTSNTLYHE